MGQKKHEDHNEKKKILQESTSKDKKPIKVLKYFPKVTIPLTQFF